MSAPEPTPQPWHSLSVDECLAALGSNHHQGLTDTEAAVRLTRHGPNRTTPPKSRGALSRLIDQLVQPLVVVLILAAAVAATIGHRIDAMVILGVVAVNAVIGFLQEHKAAAAMQALARSLVAETTVIRAGRAARIDAAELVPGDIVRVLAGDRIPADLRWIDGRGLRCDESALTGEAVPVDKHVRRVGADAPLAEQYCLGFLGTTLVAGRGHGLVVATGDNTRSGRIATLLAGVPGMATPLTRRMAAFAKVLLWVILGLSALTIWVGVARGATWADMFIAAVALAVGAIPEGLPAAMTITLAIGVSRMARRQAIVRHLPAVETLGSTTVICTDKTGTLTENAMTVREVWAGGHTWRVDGDGYSPAGSVSRAGAPMPSDLPLRELALAGLLCNDAQLIAPAGMGEPWRITGDPTEAALLVLARKAGLDEGWQAQFPRLDELAFDSTRQAMMTVHRVEGGTVAYAKGACERLLPRATTLLGPDGAVAAMDERTRGAALAVADNMAARGQRVLALARRTLDGTPPALGDDALEAEFCFLGLVGMIDPPRAHALAAIRSCHAAGMRVVMITGDAAPTAQAIAAQLNILGERGAGVATGRDIATADEAQLRAMVRSTAVFARVEPEQKLRLVEALQANGEVVAMTGDGVNDAPALRRADIGVAMGRDGTEVAKEAAAMVLTDDNFATIAAAVEEGRSTYDNLVKFIAWTLPTNFGEGLVILAAVLTGAALPILPLQILWINMTTAVLLGLPLAFEPKEPDVMRRPPRPPGQPVLDGPLIERIVLVGALMLVAAFALFEWSLASGRSVAVARTVAMNAFVAIEIAYLFNCRSLRGGLATTPWRSNAWVWWGTGLQVAGQLALTYVDVLNRLFATAPLDGASWLEVVACAAVSLAVVESHKRWRSKLQPWRSGG